MTFTRLLIDNLRHHRRAALGTALCVAVVVAVLAGALIVGDSVRGTLRHLALDRLGPYDEIVLAEQPFRADLAAELAKESGFAEHFVAAVPIILARGTVEHHGADGTRRASGVTIIGCDPAFWDPGGIGSLSFPPPPLKPEHIVLNAALAGADQLAAGVGDNVVLRIGRAGEIPSDSPLGQKELSQTVAGTELTVAAIVPDEGLGRFTLSPTQQSPLCAFVELQTLQEMLDQPGSANAILLVGRNDTRPMRERGSERDTAAPSLALRASVEPLAIRASVELHPKLADYGLKLRRVTIGDPAHPVSDYFNLTSSRLLLPQAVRHAADAAWRGHTVQPALTYLANDLEHDGRHVPYSTITAVDSIDKLGPLLDAQGRPIVLKDDEIALIDWAAEDLQAKPGDTIRVTYFDPHATHGEPPELSIDLKLKAIVPLAAPDAPPLATNDPNLTPELKEANRSQSIEKWLPFKLKPTIRPRDDQYWTDHGATPKAYVSLPLGRKLWTNRFGQTTSQRVAPAPGVTEESLAAQLAAQIKPAELGLALRPIRREALEAAGGTTPFDVLLLIFSVFLIAAVLMLLAVLFQLGIDQRASEIGLLLAIGIRARTVARLLLAEALIAAAAGAAGGALLAVGYAWLLLAGLRTGWLSAVAAPTLELHVSARCLLLGVAAGLLVAGVTITFAVRRVGRVPVRKLLAGVAQVDGRLDTAPQRSGTGVIAALVIVALTLAIGSRAGGAELQAGLFFASGALALVAAILACRALLRRGGTRSAARLSLFWLAARNAALNPRRSVLCVALLAVVAFVIIATGAFRLPVSRSGSGGFNLLAESPAPIFHDLSTPKGRAELGFAGKDAALLDECIVVALRVHDGDDASCLNLYRPRRPRIVGVPDSLAAESAGANRFAWGSTSDAAARQATDARADSVWQLLDKRIGATIGAWPVPVILDENTARYSLGLMGVANEPYHGVVDAAGNPVRLVVAGLLRNSIFQGDLLMSEANLLKLYPDTRGRRLFLIRTPPDKEAAVVTALEGKLGSFGLDVTRTRDRLAALLAVQNTYLSTFQALGGLGLLLGTLGLAAVQLRSVLERRGELALLRAEGFARRRIAALVLYENGTLMLAGLGIGAAAAMVAVWPHLAAGTAQFPWLMLCGLLLVVFACGLAASLAAVRAAVNLPLMATLRGK